MKIENIGNKQTAETIWEKATPEELAAAKKAALKNRKDFELHVGMVMHMDGESNVSAARAVAYLEGPAGLYKRLGVPAPFAHGEQEPKLV